MLAAGINAKTQGHEDAEAKGIGQVVRGVLMPRGVAAARGWAMAE